jgi:hypothetical protein
MNGAENDCMRPCGRFASTKLIDVAHRPRQREGAERERNERRHRVPARHPRAPALRGRKRHGNRDDERDERGSPPAFRRDDRGAHDAEIGVDVLAETQHIAEMEPLRQERIERDVGCEDEQDQRTEEPQHERERAPAHDFGERDRAEQRGKQPRVVAERRQPEAIVAARVSARAGGDAPGALDRERDEKERRQHEGDRRGPAGETARRARCHRQGSRMRRAV